MCVCLVNINLPFWRYAVVIPIHLFPPAEEVVGGSVTNGDDHVWLGYVLLFCGPFPEKAGASSESDDGETSVARVSLGFMSVLGAERANHGYKATVRKKCVPSNSFNLLFY